MKKGVALIVLFAVAGQALFCVDVRLGGGKPAGARYNEAWESARLDRSLAHFAPDNVRPEPMASSSSGGGENGFLWTGLGFVLGGLLCMAVSFAFDPEPEGSPDLGYKDGFFYGGLGLASLGALFTVVSFAMD